MTDHELQNRQRELWASGDLATFAARIVIVSELLCETVDLRAGERVLDVAAGTGNTAIAAARRWCDVVGIDFVPELLDRARERAKAESLAIDFRHGDAEAIPFPDHSFDVVLSTFGVMFAVDQSQTAAELLRVCRRGGRIGLANFPPDSLAARFGRAASRLVPPPRGVQPPTLWGTERGLRRLFGRDVPLSLTRRTVRMRYPSPQAGVDFFRAHFGPVRETFEALDPEGQRELAQALAHLVSESNVSGDGTVVAAWDYVEVIVTNE
ncbi:class I SAM-dependent methyltransferase [soil metagenome]